MSALPEWLEVGQPVAVLSGYGNDTITLRTVERFTKTRVVLDNGDWFPLDRLSKTVGGSYGRHHRLADPNSPGIVRAIRLQQTKRLVSDIYEASRRLGANPTDEQIAAIGTLASKLARRCEVAS